jgi:hypothetical protein
VPPPGEITLVVEYFFRHAAGKIGSTLPGFLASNS